MIRNRAGALLQDMRFAVRSLRKSPAFSAAVVGILAVGIGANAAIFSLVDAVLFRPLPLTNPDRLVRIFAADHATGEVSNSSYPVYQDYRDGSRSFSGLAAYADFVAVHLSVAGAAPERVTGSLVSGNYFDVLGVRPARGRFFGPSEDRVPGRDAVVVIGDGLWRRVFGRDPNVVGRVIRINRRPVTVVGVAPQGFFGASLDSLPELWMPVAMAAVAEPEWGFDIGNRGFSWLDIVGRLKSGVSLAEARAELDALSARRSAGQPPDRRDPWARLVPAREGIVDDVAAAARLSWILAGIVLLVLSITCADAAGLLLARADRRRREIAIRTALGASRSRLVRQVLGEALILASAGGLGGLAVAGWLVEAVRRLAPAVFPIPVGAATPVLDARVIAFSVLASLATGVIFGILPALRASRRDVLADLRGAADRRPSLPGRIAMRDAFAATQIALCTVLLVAAALLLRTVAAERAVAPGFDPDRAVVFSIDLARQGYPEATQTATFDRILESLRAVPGVRAAALARAVPVSNSGMVVTLRKDEPRKSSVDWNPVSPGFFAALGVRLTRGREFTPADAPGAPHVGVVNQALADREWPGADPVGRVLMDAGPDRGPLTIVGVVANAKFRSLREPVRPMLAVPSSQFSRPSATVLVRTAGDPEHSVASIRAAVGSIDPELPLFGVRTLRDRVAGSLGPERLLAWMLTAFAVLALALAAAGLYGVVSSAVEARRREFGIRLALGSPRGGILTLVLRRGFLLSAAGLAVGVPAAVVSARALSGLLFGVSAADPASFLGSIATLAAITVLSGAFPAYRASHADPVDSLRSE